MAFLAVKGRIDHVACLFQGLGELAIQIDIVFDYENAYVGPNFPGSRNSTVNRATVESWKR